MVPNILKLFTIGSVISKVEGGSFLERRAGYEAPPLGGIAGVSVDDKLSELYGKIGIKDPISAAEFQLLFTLADINSVIHLLQFIL